MVKEGYKQTEVGVIPEDWEVDELSNLTSEIGDGIHSTPTYTSNKDYYFINGNNLKNSQIIISKDTKTIDILEFIKYKKNLNDRTILLSINGTIGNLAFYFNEQIILGKSAAYLNVKKQISKRYIFFALQTKNVKVFFEDGLTGTTIKNLGLGVIRNTPIIIPKNSKEQKAIAKALSDTDTLITLLEKLITKKQAIKKATMQQLLTGRKRLSGFGAGKGYKQTELGEIPEDWSLQQLGEIGQFKNGINKGSDDFGYGFPFVNLMDVFGHPVISSSKTLGLVNTGDLERKVYNLQEGDVIFIRSSVKPSGVGLTTVIDKSLCNTVYSGFLIRFRDSGKLNKLFKKYCFHEEMFRQRIVSISSVSANTNINQENLMKTLILFPSSEIEQHAIAKILSDMDSDIELIKKQLNKTQQIKVAMMQELLTGKTRLIESSELS